MQCENGKGLIGLIHAKNVGFEYFRRDSDGEVIEVIPALKDVLERVSDSANYSEEILNNRYSDLPKTWKRTIKKNIVTLWKMRSDLHKTMA